MSKFARIAQTSQSLSLAAMEEASRDGLREADIEHLFLALTLSDQSAGRILRELGITVDRARRAIEDQREAQLSALGVNATFPDPGRIVFHETDGYKWSKRASDILARAGGKDRAGDAAAVLREVVGEPSGLITDLLQRLKVNPQQIREQLTIAQASFSASEASRRRTEGRRAGTTEAFVPAPIDEVWEFLSSPERIPDWEPSVGSVESNNQEVLPGVIWVGRAPETRPDGKPLKIKPQFQRRRIELVAAEFPARVAWRLSYPDAPDSGPLLTEVSLSETTGGTQATIAITWGQARGWRRALGFFMIPFRKFLIWIGLFQTSSAISRAFR